MAFFLLGVGLFRFLLFCPMVILRGGHGNNMVDIDYRIEINFFYFVI